MHGVVSFNIPEFCDVPTTCLCVLNVCQNKRRFCPIQHWVIGLRNLDEYFLRGRI